ncbi:MAG TPA: c-type cytochrome [Terriglobales bacterium]|nr:c-type cytochrome [Terriglobales bacterium]
MRIRFGLLGAAFAGALALAACNLPGKPTAADIVQRPSDLLDPVVLYQQNCAGCHGADGKLGPAPPIGDPVYLAIVDDDSLRDTISKGRPGTAMSAFAQSEGGMLTSRQIDAVVQGIRQRWGKPDVLQSGTAPPYAAQSAGNPQQGAAVFKTFCASCHGADGKGTAKVGSIVDPNYLSLISNQGLRTIVIIGRPDFNAPDWRNNVAGRPMTDQEITDVVAWLAAQRPTAAVTASTGRIVNPSSSGGQP